MSVRRETLQVARLAPKQLGDSTELVAEFVRRALTPAGGFANRAGDADLYYTFFGLQALSALQADVAAPQVSAYLATFGDGADLDLVHLACLAGCWATLPTADPGAATRRALAERLERFRTPEGGYHAAPSSTHGTAYHAYLALSACEDLGFAPPDTQRLAASLASLRAADGAFANGPGQQTGSTPATAAAVTLMRRLDVPPSPDLVPWLLARCRDGGFCASPEAPLPDLLSTATALHALVSMHASIDGIREPCLDFVDSLWTNRGGFFGTWVDDAPDCEYTFYGLLALGHLTL